MVHKLPKIMWEHTKAGVPNPCIKVRQGSGKALAGLMFNPFTSLLIETGQKVDVKKLKKAKKVKKCLW